MLTDIEHSQLKLNVMLERSTGRIRVPISRWDRRFIELARHISTWSKDPSTQCGAVIVAPDRRIVATGYNGFARGMPDDAALYEDRDVKLDRVIHCEMNAVMYARESVAGCTLYTWPFVSCSRCAVHMIQSGIRTFVAPIGDPSRSERWQEIIDRSKKYFAEAGARVREIATGGTDTPWNARDWVYENVT